MGSEWGRNKTITVNFQPMKNDQLFQLIKALTKSEKRYFKLFCSQTASTGNYERLFDAIDLQAEYEEAAIRKQFQCETFLKQLHVTKNYLRQLLLKSLRHYHSRLSRNAELKDLLRNVEILFHKELYGLCKSELQRAETLAKTAELYTGLLEVQIWQRQLAQTLHPQQYQRLAEILDAQKDTLAALENTHQFWQQAVRASGTFMGVALSKKYAEHQVPSPEQARTTEAKVLYFNTRYVQHLREGESEKGVAQLQQLLEYLEQAPTRLANNLGVYLSTLHNLVSFYVFQREFPKALDLLQRGKAAFKQQQKRGEHRSLLKQMLRASNIELEIYRASGPSAENASFIAETTAFVQQYQPKIPEDYLLSFWFQFAYIAFLQRDFDAALHWINRILNGKWKEARLDLQVQARMLNLMVHLEQQNWFVLRYFVDSTRRFYKKNKSIQPFELQLLQFFSKMGQAPEYEFKDRFRALYEALFPDGAESLVPENISRYIDYKQWIGSKFGHGN